MLHPAFESLFFLFFLLFDQKTKAEESSVFLQMDSAHLLDLNSACLPPGRLLKALPAATQEEFFKLARHVIATRFVPIVWLHHARRRRQAAQQLGDAAAYFAADTTSFSTSMSASSHKATPVTAASATEQAIKQSDDFVSFFDAPAVANLARSATLLTCKAGEIVMHQREPAHCLVVVLRGDVDFFAAPCREKQTQVAHQPDAHLPHHLLYSRVRRKGLTSCHWLHRSKGPFVFGGVACFNAEPSSSYSVCASDHTVLAFISRFQLIRCFCSLPTFLGQQLAVKANRQRAENLPLAFPLTEERIRLSPLLRDLPAKGIDFVKKCAIPIVFPKGAVICEKGSIGSSISFLRRGLVMRQSSRGSATTAGNDDSSIFGDNERTGTSGILCNKGEDEQTSKSSQESAAIFRDGATFGELELFFKEKYKSTISAVTNCDVYVFKYNDFVSLQTAISTAKEAITEAAVALREDELWLQAALPGLLNPDTSGRIPPLIANDDAIPQPKLRLSVIPPISFDEASTQIPLVQLFATPELWRDLRGLWRPRVLPAKQVVVSSADPCDRLILLISGTVKVRFANTTNRESYFHPGETIGYTCLVSHRWAQTLVAVTHCDAWELPREDFAAALRNHKIYHKVLGAAMQLVQPMVVFPHRCPYVAARVLLTMTGAASSTACQGVGSAIRGPRNTLEHLKTQNMHPVSFSETMTDPPWRPLSENSNLEVYAGKRRKQALANATVEDEEQGQAQGKKPSTTSGTMPSSEQNQNLNFFTKKLLGGAEPPISGNRQRTPTSAIFSATLDDKQEASPPCTVDPVGNLEARSVSFAADKAFEKVTPLITSGHVLPEDGQDEPPKVWDTTQVLTESVVLQNPVTPSEQVAAHKKHDVVDVFEDESDELGDDDGGENNDKILPGKACAPDATTQLKGTSDSLLSRLNHLAIPTSTDGYSMAVASMPSNRPSSAARRTDNDAHKPAAEGIRRPSSARRYLEPPLRPAPPPPPKPRAPVHSTSKCWRRADIDPEGFGTTVPRPISASEKYGSLMKRVFMTVAPPSSHQGAGASAPTSSMSTTSYLWGCSSVAAPLLSSRKENENLKVLLHRYPTIIPASWTSVYVTSSSRNMSPATNKSSKRGIRSQQQPQQNSSSPRPMPKPAVREPLNFS